MTNPDNLNLHQLRCTACGSSARKVCGSDDCPRVAAGLARAMRPLDQDGRESDVGFPPAPSETSPRAAPLYIRPWIPKGEALVLRRLLREVAMGYAESNQRVTLLKRIENEIAEAWPDDA